MLGGMVAAMIACMATLVVVVFTGAKTTPTGLAASVPAAIAPATGESELPVADESSAPASTSPSPSRSSAASKTASPTAAKTTIVPSKRPVQVAAPPAPVAVKPSGACPTNPDPLATTAEVRAQLETASTTQFLPISAPTIRVPLTLLKAIAWQESGWKSSIQSCDGGMGVMQVMPGTVPQVNNFYAKSWTPHTLSGNVNIGGAYLAWVIMYLGKEYYNGFYDVTADEGLLNSVISAYNNGPGAVDPTKGTAGITNWSYVNNVRALMTSCPCSAY